jgi:valyl-tRNA synthetase
MDNGEFTDFQGTYEKFVARKQEIKQERKQEKNSSALDMIRSLKKTSSTHGSQESAMNTGKDKIRKDGKPKVKPSDVQKELRRLEREIEKLETELDAVNELKTEHATDYEKLMELDEREALLRTQLEVLLDDWEEVASLGV